LARRSRDLPSLAKEFVMWLWLLGSAWAGDCNVPTANVSASADEAFMAFAAVDEEALVAATDRIFSDLPCVHEAFSASDAAKVHRAVALRAFFEGRVDDAKFGLAAAFRAAPSTSLSARVAPEGGKLWRLAEEASILPATTSSLPVTLRIDGLSTNQRVAAWPAIAQTTGASVETAWLAPGADLPSGWASVAVVAPVIVDPVVEPVTDPVTVDDGWDEDWDGPKKEKKEKKEKEPKEEKVAKADPEPDFEKLEPVEEDDDYDLGNTKVKKEKSGKKKSAAGLWVGTSVTAVAAAGLFGTSAYMRGQFDEEPTKAKYDLTNGTFYGSMGAAGLTVLLGGFAIAGSF